MKTNEKKKSVKKKLIVCKKKKVMWKKTNHVKGLCENKWIMKKKAG